MNTHLGIKLPRIQIFDSWIAYRDYRFLWVANFCGNTAQWMQLLTAGWLVRELAQDTSFDHFQGHRRGRAGQRGRAVCGASHRCPGRPGGQAQADYRQPVVHGGRRRDIFRVGGSRRGHPVLARLRLCVPVWNIQDHIHAHAAGAHRQHGAQGVGGQCLCRQRPHHPRAPG